MTQAAAPMKNAAPGVDPIQDVDAWDEAELEDDGGWFGNESAAFVGSMIVHLGVIVMLGLTPIIQKLDPEAIVLVSPPAVEEIETFDVVEEVTASDLPQEKVGPQAWATWRWPKRLQKPLQISPKSPVPSKWNRM